MKMGSAQQFSLRWNNYSTHIVTSLDELRSEDELTDVTLSSEGQKIRAHKLLLSACSTFFRETFRENPCQHPVIILKGVSFVDLQAVVTFMYNGQVNVTQDRLPSFLQTAEMLQIKGLTDMNDKQAREEPPSSYPNPLNTPTASSSLKKRVVTTNSVEQRSNTPETSQQRPPTPKRRKMIPSLASIPQLKYEQTLQSQEESPGGSGYNSPAGPSGSGGGGGVQGGLMMTGGDSNSAEEFNPLNPILKYEEDDEEFRNNLSEDGDNSLQDINAHDQGAIGFDGADGAMGHLQDGSSHGGWDHWDEQAARTHTCPFCHQTFRKRYNVKRHIKEKHEGRPRGT